MRTLRTVLLVLSLSSLSACATLQRWVASGFDTPTATFVDARLQSIDLDRATVLATFDLQNPNYAGLSLSEVSYALTIEGRAVGRGTLPKGVALPGRGRTTLEVPVTVAFQELGELAKSLAGRKEAAYKVEGTAAVRTPIGDLAVPLAWTGTLPIPQMPSVRLASARLDSLTFAGARASIALAVENPNTFSIQLGGLDGQLVAAEQRLAAVQLAAPRTLPAGKTETIELAVEFSLLNAATAASSMATGSTLRIVGSARVADRTVPLDLSLTMP